MAARVEQDVALAAAHGGLVSLGHRAVVEVVPGPWEKQVTRHGSVAWREAVTARGHVIEKSPVIGSYGLYCVALIGPRS